MKVLTADPFSKETFEARKLIVQAQKNSLKIQDVPRAKELLNLLCIYFEIGKGNNIEKRLYHLLFSNYGDKSLERL